MILSFIRIPYQMFCSFKNLFSDTTNKCPKAVEIILTSSITDLARIAQALQTKSRRNTENILKEEELAQLLHLMLLTYPKFPFWRSWLSGNPDHRASGTLGNIRENWNWPRDKTVRPTYGSPKISMIDERTGYQLE